MWAHSVRVLQDDEQSAVVPRTSIVVVALALVEPFFSCEVVVGDTEKVGGTFRKVVESTVVTNVR